LDEILLSQANLTLLSAVGRKAKPPPPSHQGEADKEDDRGEGEEESDADDLASSGDEDTDEEEEDASEEADDTEEEEEETRLASDSAPEEPTQAPPASKPQHHAEQAGPQQGEEELLALGKAQLLAARATVEAFLLATGFKSVSAPRWRCFRSSFALHRAVEENDVVVVRALLRCGADAANKNSAGRTPLQLAEKLHAKRGLHSRVVEALSMDKE